MLIFLVPGIGPKASCMIGKHCATELHSGPSSADILMRTASHTNASQVGTEDTPEEDVLVGLLITQTSYSPQMPARQFNGPLTLNVLVKLTSCTLFGFTADQS